MKMKFKNSSIALFVKDIEVSKTFYCDILGLEVEFDFGGNIIFKGEIAIWQIDPNHIIPKLLGNSLGDSQSNHFELYFETESLDEDYNTLCSAKVKFLHEIHEEPWGQRTIRFFDPDNHLIEIGETMRSFVTRMLNSDMTREQVSAKTGITIEDFEKILMLNKKNK